MRRQGVKTSDEKMRKFERRGRSQMRQRKRNNNVGKDNVKYTREMKKQSEMSRKKR